MVDLVFSCVYIDRRTMSHQHLEIKFEKYSLDKLTRNGEKEIGC